MVFPSLISGLGTAVLAFDFATGNSLNYAWTIAPVLIDLGLDFELF